jgi:hypothetical protein
MRKKVILITIFILLIMMLTSVPVTAITGDGQAYYVYQATGPSDGALPWATGMNGGRKLVTDGQNLYAAYCRFTAGAFTDTFRCARSADEGQTWLEVDGGGSTVGEHQPTIAIDSQGVLHAVWHNPWWDYSVWYAKSTDGGVTFTGHMQLAAWGYFEPVIAVDLNDNVHVVYETYGDIYYRMYDGSSWSTQVMLDQDSTSYHYKARASIAVDENNDVHVAWAGYYSYEIEYIKKTGTTWGAIETMPGTGDWHKYYYPCITTDNDNNPHLVWHGYTSYASYEQVFYSERKSSGWTAPAHMSAGEAGPSAYPSISVSADGVKHVVWYGYREVSGSYYSQIIYSYDDGSGWSANTALTSETTNQILPSLLDCRPILPTASGFAMVWTSRTGSHWFNNVKYLASSDFSTDLSPEASTENLIDEILDLDLPEGTENELTQTLDNVLKSLENDNDDAATGQLGAFINKIEALVNSGRMAEEDAQALIDAAESIIAGIEEG